MINCVKHTLTQSLAASAYLIFTLSSHVGYAEPLTPFSADQDTLALWHMDSYSDNNGYLQTDDAAGSYHLLQASSTQDLTFSDSARGLDQAISGFNNDTGALEYAETGQNALPDILPYTFETWIKWDDDANLPINQANLKQTVMAKLVSSSHSVWLYFENSHLYLSVRSGDGSNDERIYTAAVNPASNTWYHLAFTLEAGDFDQDSLEDDLNMSLYFNDENNAYTDPKPLVDINAATAGLIVTDFTYRANGWRFRLGKRYGISNAEFRGNIDEVRLSSVARTQFDVFQATDEHLYRGKDSFIVMHQLLFGQTRPSNATILQNYGMPYLPTFGHGLDKYWDTANGVNPYYDFPQKDIIQAWAKTEMETFGYMDIEHLPEGFLDSWNDDGDGNTPAITIDDSDRKRAMRELIAIADWVHAANPDLKFGYYGVLPSRTYYTFVDAANRPTEVAQLNDRNEMFQALARHVDVLFPSIYTFYNDPANWKIYAKGMYDTSRQYLKPTYAFIWPQYHGSNEQLGDQFIDGQYWRMQLEELYRLGFDGVVIWGGWQQDWTMSASDTNPSNWWYQTLDFLHSKDMLPENSPWSPVN